MAGQNIRLNGPSSPAPFKSADVKCPFTYALWTAVYTFNKLFTTLDFTSTKDIPDVGAFSQLALSVFK